MGLVAVMRRQQRDAGAGSGADGAAVGGAADGGRQVRDVLRHGVLAAHAARVDAVGFARLGQRVVARVEVLALLQVLGEVVAAGGQFAVQAEEALFFGREGLFGGGCEEVSLLIWSPGGEVVRGREEGVR